MLMLMFMQEKDILMKSSRAEGCKNRFLKASRVSSVYFSPINASSRCDDEFCRSLFSRKFNYIRLITAPVAQVGCLYLIDWCCTIDLCLSFNHLLFNHKLCVFVLCISQLFHLINSITFYVRISELLGGRDGG